MCPENFEDPNNANKSGLPADRQEDSPDPGLDQKKEAGKKAYYSKLYRRFVLITLFFSIIPLVIVGIGINIHYSKFSKSRMTHAFSNHVEQHRQVIDTFFRDRIFSLKLIAQTHSLDYLSKEANLLRIFYIVNQEYKSLTDLGVIDETGRHLAYIGPYELINKDYSQTLWFKKVMEEGVYVSDMFMGFRGVPHCILAVTRTEGDKKWILRATIDTEAFRALVEKIRIGETGEVYLINDNGIFQTSSRFSGSIMGKSTDSIDPSFEGVKINISEPEAKNSQIHQPRQIVAYARLHEPHWILVLKQNYSEAFNDINHANFAILVFIILSASAILLVSLFTSGYMIQRIKRRDLKVDQLNKQLLEAGKLAAIGELSAGVAHEINNPLAIMVTEKQILLDFLSDNPNLEQLEEQLLESLLKIDIQIRRCKRLTQNLLRFSRRTESVIEAVDLNSFLKELSDLMEREAQTNGIKLFADYEKNLPPILSDPSQLQQVFLNLITNAIDAHDDKSYGKISISTKFNTSNQMIEVEITDTGCGISPENLDKIFEPFFTTKPTDKATGLGLSISRGIIKKLGGNISVKSELGKGTEFHISLPLRPPPDLREFIENSAS